MSIAQSDYCLTAEEEARMALEANIEAVRWPIDDEGYLEALDTAAPTKPLGLPEVLLSVGKTQSDLARVLGSRSRASEYLTGKRELTKGAIIKIATAWGVSADVLLGIDRALVSEEHPVAAQPSLVEAVARALEVEAAA